MNTNSDLSYKQNRRASEAGRPGKCSAVFNLVACMPKVPCSAEFLALLARGCWPTRRPPPYPIMCDLVGTGADFNIVVG
ncbi:hypothetical protein Ddc_10833 [Ditylenchus destructor]|nr:hypothetical protein Ddc_10833 [Ditylenchus destructor]